MVFVEGGVGVGGGEGEEEEDEVGAAVEGSVGDASCSFGWGQLRNYYDGIGDRAYLWRAT